MARGFSETEKVEIKKNLIEEFIKSLEHQSIKKISIDDLVEKVGISKGSFYLFYDSKEWLFVDVVNHVQNAVITSLLDLAKEELPIKEKIKGMLKDLVNQLQAYPWLQQLTSVEYEKNIRKLPQEVRKSLLDNDVADLNKIFGLMNFVPKGEIEVIAGAIQIILFSIIGKEQLGEKYNESLDFLISSLIDKIV
jgi:AcrR family transcriptional regulator